MFGNDLSPPVYLNKVEQLKPFSSRELAELWLKKNKSDIDTNSTPLLVPFENDLGRIEFLKPKDDKDCIRIMGAGNKLRDKNTAEKFIDWYRMLIHRDFVPHINHLEGDTILLEENGFIVIYERGEKQAGEKFAKFFRRERDDLKSQIELTQTNDGPKIEEGRFIQGLSELAMGLEIIAGMCYFTKDDDKGKQNLYRHTFKEGIANPKIAPYLAREEKYSIRVHNNKIENSHRVPFLIHLAVGISASVIMTILAGFIASIFIASFITAPLAVATFIGLSFLAFCKASKDNPKTIEFGNVKFETIKPNISTSNKLKFDLIIVVTYLREKLFGIKYTIPQVSQPVKNEMAALQSPVTAQAKVTTRVEQNIIPRKLSTAHTTTEERSYTVPVAKVTPFVNTSRSISILARQSISSNSKNKKQSGGTGSITSSFCKFVKKEGKHIKGVCNDIFRSPARVK